ncbi:MAG TPA: hypothetical protein VGF41_02890, partial [Myxococcaceae bacterium]
MDARGNPAAAGQSARWKRVGVGCLAVLGVCGILGLVVGALVMRSRFPGIFQAAAKGQELMKGATTSPAAQALTDSLCSQAMVLPIDEMAKLAGGLGGKDRDVSKLGYRWLVNCHVRVASSAPGCDAVASAFHQAIHEKGGFVVMVTAGLVRGSAKPLCRQTYDADGRLVRRAHADAGASQE